MHNTWSGSYITSVRIPSHHPFAFATFQVSTSSCKLNPRTLEEAIEKAVLVVYETHEAYLL